MNGVKFVIRKRMIPFTLTLIGEPVNIADPDQLYDVLMEEII